jgi:tetratricopeptide (TPR) repeat protein
LQWAGKKAEALAEANAAVALEPASPRAALTSALFAWPDSDDALPKASRALQLGPDSIDALLLHTRILLFSAFSPHDPAGALRDAKHANELVPDDPEILGELGRSYAATGDLATCDELVTRSLALKEQSWVVHLRGYTRAEANRIDDALVDLKRAIDLDPKSVFAHSNYASVLSAVGKHQLALDEIEKAIALEPENVWHRAVKANLQVRLGDIAAARRTLETVPAGEVPADVALARARIFAAEGDAAKARASYEEAIKGLPWDFDVHQARAELAKLGAK